MKQELLKLLFVAAVVAAIVCLILAVLATIGGVRITDGCLYRYNFDAAGSPADVIAKTVILKGHGNYNPQRIMAADGSMTLKYDPNTYGYWLNTGVEAQDGQEVNYKIVGEVSLCKAYLPTNNIQNIRDRDKDNKRIEIPRIEDPRDSPLLLYFDAKIDEWRNIAELYPNDKIIVSISPEQKDGEDSSGNVVPASTITFFDQFTKDLITTDCSDGKTRYHPICGRYSIYGGQYVAKCVWKEKCYRRCGSLQCYWRDFDGTCSDREYHTIACPGAPTACEKPLCDDYSCWDNVYGNMPMPYKRDGSRTIAWAASLPPLMPLYDKSCNTGPPNYQLKDLNEIMDINASNPLLGTVKESYLQNIRTWYSADEATALLYRIDNNINPTNIKNRGTSYNFAEILEDQSAYNNPNNKIILNTQHAVLSINYLQYRFIDDNGRFADNTGGYVLGIKQTKCRRSNGISLSDIFLDRGRVQYVITPFATDPNKAGTTILARGDMIPRNPEGEGSFRMPTGVKGYVWIRILNDANDYAESTGEYSVHFLSANTSGKFGILILNPLMELKNMITDAGRQIFSNMTCYRTSPTSTCINFFNYIRGMLTLYMALYGLFFLLGVVQINQLDLIIKIIKIVIIAGLLNEKAFEFFQGEIFPFITKFSDTIIANISGYKLFSADRVIAAGVVNNPLTFLDTLMSRILFSTTFLGQMLALLSMGISGILYFILIFIAIVITIITVLRSIAIYLMAFTSIAVLIGIAPLFLTFALFESTKYLFENWVRFTIRYMMEPVILFAGIIVLIQLFTIYLDYAVGYSVCWKCALSFILPFPTIPGLEFLSNIELFCLNWFAPWGFDHRSGMMGINIQHIISLLIISYCLYGYVELSDKMIARLVSGNTQMPSATAAGAQMASALGNRTKQGEDGKVRTGNRLLSRFGFDAISRHEISQQAKQRMKNRATPPHTSIKR